MVRRVGFVFHGRLVPVVFSARCHPARAAGGGGRRRLGARAGVGPPGQGSMAVHASRPLRRASLAGIAVPRHRIVRRPRKWLHRLAAAGIDVGGIGSLPRTLWRWWVYNCGWIQNGSETGRWQQHQGSDKWQCVCVDPKPGGGSSVRVAPEVAECCRTFVSSPRKIIAIGSSLRKARPKYKRESIAHHCRRQ